MACLLTYLHGTFKGGGVEQSGAQTYLNVERARPFRPEPKCPSALPNQEKHTNLLLILILRVLLYFVFFVAFSHRSAIFFLGFLFCENRPVLPYIA